MFSSSIMMLRASAKSARIHQRFFSVAASDVAAVPSGTKVGSFYLRNEENFRVYMVDKNSNKNISAWHDIDLYVDKANGIVNYVNEIPKGAVEKMEVATDEKDTPIKQDVKKGKLRLYPFQSLVNYGCLPQTWEDPAHADESTGYLGDNDPVDVVEIGSAVALCGSVYPVKLIGVLGMIDEGEMDWKVIAINTEDPLAKQLNSVQDVEKHMPGKIDEIVTWFKTYKMPDGKPENEFAFDGKAMDLEFTKKVVESTHQLWANKDNIKAKGLWVE